MTGSSMTSSGLPCSDMPYSWEAAAAMAALLEVTTDEPVPDAPAAAALTIVVLAMEAWTVVS